MNQFQNTESKDDTLRVQNAIAVLPEDGKLVFDPGDYHITSVFLKSNMTLEIEKGARILGNTNIDDYPLMPGEASYLHQEKKQQLAAWEGNPFQGKPSIFNAFYQHNINIVGEGLIDGQADKSAFWNNVKNLTWARPRILFFNGCHNIYVQGISIANSPCWTIHPYFSEKLGFYDIYISNPKDTPNTDGMDPECCSDVEIIGVHFSVGDDCIALKSGKIYIGSTYMTPCQKVVIRNCYMFEGHGAVVLGSEAGAGIKEITVERCLFEHTDRGLRIKSRRGRGKNSIINNIVFKNIRMKNVLTPLVINMFYFCDPDGKSEFVQKKTKQKVDDTTPYLGSFVFQNIECTDAEYALGYFYGLPEQPIGSITIKDSSFTVKKDASKGYPAMLCDIEETSKLGFYFNNVSKVVISNVKAEGYIGEEAITNNVASFKKI
jgi:polygalacturonase